MIIVVILAFLSYTIFRLTKDKKIIRFDNKI